MAAKQTTWVSVLEDVEPVGRKQFLTLFADGSQRVAHRLECRRGEFMAYFNHAGKTLVKWGVIAWMDCPEPMKLSERNKIARKLETAIIVFKPKTKPARRTKAKAKA